MLVIVKFGMYHTCHFESFKSHFTLPNQFNFQYSTNYKINLLIIEK